MGGKGRFFGGTMGTTLAVSELDGTWDVERRGGLLPPLVGVHKRIKGTGGETRIGPIVGVPFDVDGLSLRYRGPFRAFVDELEPDGDGFAGRATFRGREFGRFALRRRQGGDR
jgi:hypothetical protein